MYVTCNHATKYLFRAVFLFEALNYAMAMGVTELNSADDPKKGWLSLEDFEHHLQPIGWYLGNHSTQLEDFHLLVSVIQLLFPIVEWCLGHLPSPMISRPNDSWWHHSKAEISSNSWGGHSESLALQTAIQVAMEAGHLFVSWLPSWWKTCATWKNQNCWISSVSEVGKVGVWWWLLLVIYPMKIMKSGEYPMKSPWLSHENHEIFDFSGLLFRDLKVSAAGNDNRNADLSPFYPCVYPHVSWWDWRLFNLFDM